MKPDTHPSYLRDIKVLSTHTMEWARPYGARQCRFVATALRFTSLPTLAAVTTTDRCTAPVGRMSHRSMVMGQHVLYIGGWAGGADALMNSRQARSKQSGEVRAPCIARPCATELASSPPYLSRPRPPPPPWSTCCS